MFRTLLISTCIICSATSADTPVVYEDFKLNTIEYERFGGSVSISNGTLVIGAPNADDNGFKSGSAYIYEFDGVDWIEETKLIPSDNYDSDQFGGSVAIDGNTIVVGAQGDDDNGDLSGSAYIYRFDGSSWFEEAKILPIDWDGGFFFGWDVAIDGETIIVGAQGDDDNGVHSGSAYIYRFNGAQWVEEAKLLASDGATSDYFGCSVAISDNVAIVGATRDDDNGTNSGSAYIYRFNGTQWIEEAKLTAFDGANEDRFGFSVGIDDETVIVGSSQDDNNDANSGSVYIYNFDGSNWALEQKLVASDGDYGGQFGYSLALDNETIIVGANWDASGNQGAEGSAYIYRFNGTQWIEEAKLLASDGGQLDGLGTSVALEGNIAIAGAGGYSEKFNNDGVYIFDITPLDTDGDGVPDDIDNCYLYNPDQADCNENGIGDICDVADSTSFDCDQNNVPDECQPDCDGDGWIDACDNEGDCDDDGIPDNCELDCNENNIPDDCDIIYGISEDCNENGVPDECDFADGTEADCNYNNIPDSCDIADGTEEDCNENGVPDSCGLASTYQEMHYFDDRLAGFDGETAIIGINDILNGGAAALQIYTLVDSNWIEEDYIPLEVSYVSLIKMDQNIAVVQGPGEGSAFNSSLLIFRFNGTQWIQEAHIQTPDPWAGFGFLGMYEISNNRIIVSGYSNHIAYIYMFNGTEWILEAELDPFADSSYDSELSVDIDGDTVVLGAWSIEDSPGVVYIYKFDGSNWTEETFFSANDPANGDAFCFYVQIDGEHLAISNQDTFLYRFDGTEWILEAELNPFADPSFYDVLTVALDGDTVVVGAAGGSLPQPKNVYIYDFEEGNWLLKSEIVSNNEDDFGFGWRTQLHGDIAMISGNSGRSYIYTNQIQSDFDCNSNGILDECELNSENDLNNNGVLDECECFADINLDGYVNVNDLLIIIGYWGNNTPQADINFDGIVDVSDLLIVVGNWGPCE
jgi:hypothetical protein